MEDNNIDAVIRRLEQVPKPVIAAVFGYALGGGLELAMGADFRYLAEDAKVGQPEIRLGIIPGAGGTQRLPRLVGFSRGKELVYSGRHVPADEALAMGLADKVFPADELLEAAIADAGRIRLRPHRGFGSGQAGRKRRLGQADRRRPAGGGGRLSGMLLHQRRQRGSVRIFGETTGRVRRRIGAAALLSALALAAGASCGSQPAPPPGRPGRGFGLPAGDGR